MSNSLPEALDAGSDGDRWATTAERDEAARQAYRQRLADGVRFTGAELGALFGRSGRYRIAEVTRDHAEAAGTNGRGHGNPDGNGNSYPPAVNGHGPRHHHQSPTRTSRTHHPSQIRDG